MVSWFRGDDGDVENCNNCCVYCHVYKHVYAMHNHLLVLVPAGTNLFITIAPWSWQQEVQVKHTVHVPVQVEYTYSRCG